MQLQRQPEDRGEPRERLKVMGRMAQAKLPAVRTPEQYLARLLAQPQVQLGAGSRLQHPEPFRKRWQGIPRLFSGEWLVLQNTGVRRRCESIDRGTRRLAGRWRLRGPC